jgi:DNA-binding NarL/FixJ family response regulator
MCKIKVLLAEDHTIVRQGIRSLLEPQMDIEVIGEAEDGLDAVKKTEELRPDVVIMDISMPKLNGIDATRLIKKNVPNAKVLVLTMHELQEYVEQILRAGASGYLVKKTAMSELINAIRAVNQGLSFLSPSVSKKIVDKYIKKTMDKGTEKEPITGRERQILQLIAEGHSNKEIAKILSLSIRTVEAHRLSIMDKLDIHDVAGLTRYAIQKGLIQK